MNKRKLFLWLAAASGYIGIGMLLGYSFGDHNTNTALWIGILLVIAAAVLIGMYISARNDVLSAKQVSSSNDDSVPKI